MPISASFRPTSSSTPTRGGYIVTIAVEEGAAVPHRQREHRIPAFRTSTPTSLRGQLATSAGAVYNADAVERSLQNVTTEVARRGYAFAQVRPVGTRDPATQTVNLGYVVEEGPRVYIERINVRGNTRTRDYVVRREFDLGEGDAYNKVLVDRAERRLNNLGYFKKVRITNEPGSAPDRVVVNVDVEDQSTGSFSISGGYSTSDGFIGEVSVSESNFLGRGQFVRIAGQLGQRTQGVDFSFTEPYFLGYRLAAGIDLFSKFSDQTNYARYENRVTGGQLRLGLPVTEEFGVTLRYSLFQQDLEIPNDFKQPYQRLLRSRSRATPPSNAERHAEPILLRRQRRSLARDQGIAGRHADLARGPDVQLQLARQHQGPAQRLLRRAQDRTSPASAATRVTSAPPATRATTTSSSRTSSASPASRAATSVALGGDDLRIVDHFFLGPSPGARLRLLRHRAARHFEPRQPVQRHRRHDLFRRLARSAVPDLRPAAGTRPEGRRLRRCRHAVRLQGRDARST